MNNPVDSSPQRWDIFCRVIDNYGDIGVCWRLARQLQAEYGLSVRLWLDDITALRRIWPSTEDKPQQQVAGVEVILWGSDFPITTPADVVIEAFACELPPSYITAMAQQVPQPHWLNLEYLSAEAWVDECHGMRSIHPQNGLLKTFFFPGFTDKTGGLLREANLSKARTAVQTAPDTQAAFLKPLGVVPQSGSLLISLFAYENPAIQGLLDAWRQSSRPIQCLVPEGKILTSINHYLGTTLEAGTQLTLEQLTLQVIPFLTQEDYDKLLWCCDINFVRGEDSFIRAQWAARPLVWHIYPQDEDAHLVKLSAFADRYRRALPKELSVAIDDLWLHWNRGEDCENAWNQCLQGLSEWQRHSQNWEQALNSLGDLTAKLVHFCKKPL